MNDTQRTDDGDVIVSVYRHGGALWTQFGENCNTVEIARKVFEWQAQPGCERIVVSDRDTCATWIRR